MLFAKEMSFWKKFRSRLKELKKKKKRKKRKAKNEKERLK